MTSVSYRPEVIMKNYQNFDQKKQHKQSNNLSLAVK